MDVFVLTAEIAEDCKLTGRKAAPIIQRSFGVVPF